MNDIRNIVPVGTIALCGCRVFLATVDGKLTGAGCLMTAQVTGKPIRPCQIHGITMMFHTVLPHGFVGLEDKRPLIAEFVYSGLEKQQVRNRRTRKWKLGRPHRDIDLKYEHIPFFVHCLVEKRMVQWIDDGILEVDNPEERKLTETDIGRIRARIDKWKKVIDDATGRTVQIVFADDGCEAGRGQL